MVVHYRLRKLQGSYRQAYLYYFHKLKFRDIYIYAGEYKYNAEYYLSTKRTKFLMQRDVRTQYKDKVR